MEFRQATTRNSDAVVDLTAAMLREMASHSNQSLSEDGQIKSQLRRRFMNSLEKEDHIYLVARLEGEEKLAGIVEASVASPPEIFRPRLVVHIHSLYVQPHRRREGIGRRLLEEILEWGRAKGCVEAELSVLVGNPARELYERLGFVVSEFEMRRRL